MGWPLVRWALLLWRRGTLDRGLLARQALTLVGQPRLSVKRPPSCASSAIGSKQPIPADSLIRGDLTRRGGFADLLGMAQLLALATDLSGYSTPNRARAGARAGIIKKPKLDCQAPRFNEIAGIENQRHVTLTPDKDLKSRTFSQAHLNHDGSLDLTASHFLPLYRPIWITPLMIGGGGCSVRAR